ncbi:unnamed protein product [Rhizopus stolonifer]
MSNLNSFKRGMYLEQKSKKFAKDDIFQGNNNLKEEKTQWKDKLNIVKERSLRDIWSKPSDSCKSSSIDLWNHHASNSVFSSSLLDKVLTPLPQAPPLSQVPQTSRSLDYILPSPVNFMGQRKKNWSKPSTRQESSASDSSVTSLPQEQNVRYLSDSVSFYASNAALLDESTSIIRDFKVVKAINIPWHISSNDVKEIICKSGSITLPSIEEIPQCVHIIMDIKTGKTLGVAFIEYKVEPNQDILYELGKLLPVKGRRLRFTKSSYDELLEHLFPDWQGSFSRGLAHASISTKIPFFLTQKDLQNLLNICKNYKIYYNRKCAERPFEYLISIVVNIPWKQPKTVTTIQRDLIYECYKLATDTLRIHISKDFSTFEKDILSRLVRAAIVCPGFSVKQKNGVLSNAQVL